MGSKHISKDLNAEIVRRCGSLRNLADKVGINYDTLYGKFAGRSEWKVYEAVKVAKVLGLNLTEFVRLTEGAEDGEPVQARRPYKPERGAVYENHGGGVFRCMTTPSKNLSGYYATMQNIKSGWTFQAIGIHRYQDGTIDWDYSTNGIFWR